VQGDRGHLGRHHVDVVGEQLAEGLVDAVQVALLDRDADEGADDALRHGLQVPVVLLGRARVPLEHRLALVVDEDGSGLVVGVGLLEVGSQVGLDRRCDVGARGRRGGAPDQGDGDRQACGRGAGPVCCPAPGRVAGRPQ
jgi:hypothetical protein